MEGEAAQIAQRCFRKFRIKDLRLPLSQIGTAVRALRELEEAMSDGKKEKPFSTRFRRALWLQTIQCDLSAARWVGFCKMGCWSSWGLTDCWGTSLNREAYKEISVTMSPASMCAFALFLLADPAGLRSQNWTMAQVGSVAWFPVSRSFAVTRMCATVPRPRLNQKLLQQAEALGSSGSYVDEMETTFFR